MKRISLDKMELVFRWTLLAFFTALFLLKAYTTLHWRIEHDTALCHYVAFLMDKHGLVPYRDFFETSMPGTFAFHYGIVKGFGYGDVAFRHIDLAILGGLLLATYAFMRRFGRQAAVAGIVLLGLLYFAKGQTMSLQRDYIGVIPVAFALLAIPARLGNPVRLARFAWIGLLFCLSVLIKPHLGIAFPVVFGCLLAARWISSPKSMPDFLKCAAAALVPLAIPSLLTLIWLAAHSALGPFLETLRYLPLYNSMTGALVRLSTLNFAFYLAESTIKFGGYSAVWMCALFAYYHVAVKAGEDKSISIPLTCLILCTFAYALYPALAGKFYNYHYMPFAYFCSLSAGLCLFSGSRPPMPDSMRGLRRFLPALILLIAATTQLSLPRYLASTALDIRQNSAAHAPKKGRVDEIACWLKDRLHPGYTVQPLDVTGGSIHGMLLAKAKLATRFQCDYHFYHHVSSPFIRQLRQSFIQQLRDAPPRFIIDVLDKVRVSGIDTSNEFPELQEILDADYVVACKGDGYLIYERKSAPRASDALVP